MDLMLHFSVFWLCLQLLGESSFTYSVLSFIPSVGVPSSTLNSLKNSPPFVLYGPPVWQNKKAEKERSTIALHFSRQQLPLNRLFYNSHGTIQAGWNREKMVEQMGIHFSY